MRILLLFSAFLLISFTSCKEELIGLCDSPFEIKVGSPINEDDYKVYIVSVKNHHHWWLSGIAINGNIETNNWNEHTRKDKYVLDNEKYIFEKIDNSSIKIKLKAEESNAPLKLHISLQSGNCGGGFSVEK